MTTFLRLQPVPFRFICRYFLPQELVDSCLKPGGTILYQLLSVIPFSVLLLIKEKKEIKVIMLWLALFLDLSSEVRQCIVSRGRGGGRGSLQKYIAKPKKGMSM